MRVFKNETGEDEIGFKTSSIAEKVLEVNRSIDIYCHSNEDNYMMQLLAKITKLAIDKNYIFYDELYYFNEDELFNLLKRIKDEELERLIFRFENIKRLDIPILELPKIKKRKLNPIASETRLK